MGGTTVVARVGISVAVGDSGVDDGTTVVGDGATVVSDGTTVVGGTMVDVCERVMVGVGVWKGIWVAEAVQVSVIEGVMLAVWVIYPQVGVVENRVVAVGVNVSGVDFGKKA